MSDHKYYTIETKVTGKQYFSTVKEAKYYIYEHWDAISAGHDNTYSVKVMRNLIEYGRYAKFMGKIVKVG